MDPQTSNAVSEASNSKSNLSSYVNGLTINSNSFDKKLHSLKNGQSNSQNNSYASVNGTSNHSLDNKISGSNGFFNKNNGSSSSTVKEYNNDHYRVPTPPPPPPPAPIISSPSVRRPLIGPQLPPHMMEEAAQGKLFDLSDNNTSKLVDYDEESSDEETNMKNTNKNDRYDHDFHRSNSYSKESSKFNRSNGNSYSNYSHGSKTPPAPIINGNSNYTNGNSNGSSPESRYSSHSNSKSEYSGRSEKRNSRDDFHSYSRNRFSDSYEKVTTKASKWQVSKDSVVPRTPMKVNGWDVDYM